MWRIRVSLKTEIGYCGHTDRPIAYNMELFSILAFVHV